MLLVGGLKYVYMMILIDIPIFLRVGSATNHI